MEAVLYSIREEEKAEQFSLVQKDGLPAERMYAMGARRVREKTKEALALYNEMMLQFSGYGNKCLEDTVVKGLPEFFKWYDCKYEPQNTILTLDYPVLSDLSELTGIDKIYDYISCIELEQRFLNKFSPEYVTEVLFKYDKQYRLMIENLCEIILMNIIGHIVAGKNISLLHFEPEEYSKMQTWIQRESLDDLREKIRNAVRAFIQEYYGEDEKLIEYFYKAVDSISVRMKCAGDHGNLCCIL